MLVFILKHRLRDACRQRRRYAWLHYVTTLAGFYSSSPRRAQQPPETPDILDCFRDRYGGLRPHRGNLNNQEICEYMDCLRAAAPILRHSLGPYFAIQSVNITTMTYVRFAGILPVQLFRCMRQAKVLAHHHPRKVPIFQSVATWGEVMVYVICQQCASAKMKVDTVSGS